MKTENFIFVIDEVIPTKLRYNLLSPHRLDREEFNLLKKKTLLHTLVWLWSPEHLGPDGPPGLLCVYTTDCRCSTVARKAVILNPPVIPRVTFLCCA